MTMNELQQLTPDDWARLLNVFMAHLHDSAAQSEQREGVDPALEAQDAKFSMYEYIALFLGE